MVILSTDKQEIQVNHLGFIEHCSFIQSELPVYLVFFKEHSHLNPTCRQFDISSSMQNVCQLERVLTYDKKIEGVLCNCTIAILDDGFDWSIKLQPPYPADHRFGVVCPIEENSKIVSFGKKIDFPVCNYFNVFKQTFRDQSLLSLPALSAASLMISSDPSKNTQFYVHKNSPWNIRTTSLTSNSNECIFHVREIRNSDEMHPVFSSIYPGFITNSEHAQLETKYGIPIKCYVGEKASYRLREYEYEIRQPSDKNLLYFCSNLQKELNKYPQDFFTKVGLDGIYLCSDIRKKTNIGSNIVPGFYLGNSEGETLNWLFFNVDMNFSWLIHHEVFHRIEDALGECPWKHGNMSFFKDEFGLVPEDTRGFDDVEFRADMFGCIMSQTQKLKTIIKNKLLKEQIALIMNFVRPLIDLSEVWSTKKRDQEYRHICSYLDTSMKCIQFGKLIEADFYTSSPNPQLVEKLNELHNRD